MSLSSEEGDPGAEGLVDKGYMFLDKVSMPLGEGWDPRVITPGPERIARPLFAEYEFTSQDNEWASTSYGQADSFVNYVNRNLFFGTVRWTGTNGYKELPIKVGQDLLWVHVPGTTFIAATENTPAVYLTGPWPIMVDKAGRFGVVLPPGVNYVYVKMYGTLWKKIEFPGDTNSVQVQPWNGSEVDYTDELTLRYGDVDENDVINPITDLAYLEERVGGQVRMDVSGNLTIFGYDYVCDLNRDNKVEGMLVADGAFFTNLLRPTSPVSGAVMP